MAHLQGQLALIACRHGLLQQRHLLQRFMFPEPRVQLGLQLRGIASACIDVSDGLAADAGRLAAASGCAVTLDMAALPLSEALRACCDADQALTHALRGGDDYELCFTVPQSRRAEFDSRLANVKCRVTCIGKLTPGSGIRVERDGVPVDTDTRGYDHFAHG